MYTIFKNDRRIILTDDHKTGRGVSQFSWNDLSSIKALDHLFSEGQRELFLYDADLEGMWEDFKDKYKVIEASGGIVKNDIDQLLFIFRHGKWDLPKGKIEVGESRESAGVREVMEECGFQKIELGMYIGPTYHLYEEPSDEVLKISHWFEMFSNETELFPQTEEGITDLKWVHPDDLNFILGNTYPSITLLVDLYRLKLL